MRRELVGAGLATAVLVGGAFLGSAATAQPGGADAAGQAVSAAGPVKDPDAQRERPSAPAFGSQGVVVDGAVARISGANRYDTAAVIAKAYGWDASNTISVYITSGLDYPDALAIGPSTYDDGPLLFVRKTGVPAETAAALRELRPCYIHVIGGTTAIPKTVLDQLKPYADPQLCEAS